MSKENNEPIEPIDAEVVEETTTGSAIQTKVNAESLPIYFDAEYQKSWARAKISFAKQAIREIILASKPSDWIAQGKHPTPTETIANSIIRVFGGVIKNYTLIMSETFDKRNGEKEHVIEKQCTIDFGPYGVSTDTGQASTRDTLLGYKDGEYRKMEDVSIGKVSSKATTRSKVRAACKLFSLTPPGFTWEILTKINPKLNKESVAGIKYQGSGNGNEDRSPANKAKMAIMERMVNAMWPGNATAIKAYLIGITENKEKGWAGKDKIAKFSEKQVAYHYNKSVPPKFFEWCETPEGVDPVPWREEMEKIGKMEGSK